ncbi:MAG: molybdopterin-dependent oxidoreductase [Firmicutes bacterium]|nr:molybdopterin-dependent oxidoreductase [Bacillota bacterium]
MKIGRRTFIKGSVGAGGTLAAGRLLFGELETLVDAGESRATAPGEDWVPTTCWIGKQECGILARRINGRLVKLEGHPDHPRNLGRLCPKGIAQIMAVYDPNRVKTPLVRTNEKGVTGKWRQASWDEALSLVGEKIKEVRTRDKRLLIWQKGRSKAESFYDNAFVKASGATKLGHGAYCSDAGYRACEYTIGSHGVLHPDIRHTRYLLAWGWNVTNAGGNKLCWITWPRELVEAKERGLKVVAIDPRLRGSGPFADEWVPIRPGTDLALALALCNAVIQEGTIDREYLAKYTNAGFLVKDDGYFLKIDGKEQVWDQPAGAPRAAGSEGALPPLEGTFVHAALAYRTAYQVFKDHVARYTPEWAAGVCGISAEAVTRIARELGRNAAIGSTVVLDGVELPHRPVGIMAYHMSQQELGFQAIRAMLILMMLLGAVEAVGGQRIDFTWKVDKNYEALDKVEIKDPPYNVYLKDSKYFPINSANPSVVAKVMADPQKYGVNYTPEVLIIHMTNSIVAFADQTAMMKAYDKFKFIAVIDPWLSETADLYADVILPAATIEKYEGPMKVSDQYTDAVSLRLPPMDPMFQSRGDIDIYLDLCEKAGILYGKGGYLDELNKALGFKEGYTMSLDNKPAVREIFDRWAKSEGITEGVAYFEKKGVKVKGRVPAKKIYGFAQDPPFSGLRHRLYGESLLRLGETMKAKGAEEIYWQDYTPLPTWRRLTMNDSPSEYDLYLISFKQVEFKQSRSSFIPLLAEAAPGQRVEINPATAQARGISDGDEVWVESHNAINGETRKLKTVARYRQGIRPDTVGMAHHFGLWTHPWAKGQGPSPNSIFFSGEGYVVNTADQSFHVKVRVYKA